MIADANNEASGRPFWPFVVYLAGFFAAWTGWVWLLYPAIAALGPASLAYAAAGVGSRLVLWLVPVALYLRLVDRVPVLDFLKLRKFWRRGLVIGVGLGVVNFALSALAYGPPHLDASSLTWNSVISTSLLIGVFEETVFRGFIYQKLLQRIPIVAANLVSSLLFVAIHLPGWISLGLFNWSAAAMVFAIGVVLAAAFQISKSLWAPIVAHSANDLLAAIVFHAG